MSFQDVTPEQARALLDKDQSLTVLDVRTPMEFERYHLPGAVLLPVQELPQRFTELQSDAAHLIVCEHGVRSQAACEFLHQRGFAALINLQGGMARWVAERLPTD